jgi:predicted 3-demethylubiquinone-9 3-methyltransferase (glyoxalase superfamily)/predicted dinucleotide-binding enzyme
MKIKKIGIVGSGQIGGTLGMQLGKAGYEILYSSRHPETLHDLVKATGPKARAGSVAEAIAFGDVIVLSLPLKAFRELDQKTKQSLKGKIVIDTSNPYPERNGAIAEEALKEPGGTGSFVARLLPGARIIRAFNTVYFKDLGKTVNKDGETIGIPIAGDDREGLQAAVELAEQAGLDPVVVGSLSKSKRFDAGTAVYATSASARKIKEILNLKGGKQKITPHLWFDKEAGEAAAFYTSIFRDSEIVHTTTLHNTPSGSVDIVAIALSGQQFMLISAGPLFKFTPAVSFLVASRAKDEVGALWARLSEGGMALMELGAYPFSEKYGWLQDRYGLSWQVMFMAEREIRQKITPTLMFVGRQCGKAEEAIEFYVSVFRNAKVGDIHRYGRGEEPDREGTVKHAAFTLEGQEFAAMDSAHEHDFTFNEAISFMVSCESQEEIDYYWVRLSAVPEAEQCGWLKDRYGLSWQIVPTVMDEMMRDKDPRKIARVTEAFLKMKKFDIAALKRAYREG